MPRALRSRPLLALSCVIYFTFALLAPMLSAFQAESRIPQCCRRNGAHHCAMLAASNGAPAVSATCPSFPQPSATAPATNVAALVPPPPATLLHRTTFTASQRAETQRRLSRERSRHKRGPPSFSL